MRTERKKQKMRREEKGEYLRVSSENKKREGAAIGAFSEDIFPDFSPGKKEKCKEK